MSYRRSVLLIASVGLCACGGSGDGDGGGSSLNLANFQTASVVLGQTTANGITANNGAGVDNPNQIGLEDPRGAVGNGSLYVADHGNNRVLGWNSAPTGLGQPADFVLGQGSFTSGTPGLSATALNGPRSCWVGSNALFVADTLNHRVLVYSPPPTSNVAANLVLGQPDLTTATVAAGGQNGLFAPEDVCVAADRIVVADSSNNRVLIWNGIPASSGANAQLVVGQPDFTTTSSGTAADKMNSPRGVWTDGTRLAVVDTVNHRVLVWTTFPTSNGQPADLVVGQVDFAGNSPGVGSQKFNSPGSVASDGFNLFVADRLNNRVLVFGPFPVSSNPTATGVLGQSNFTRNTDNDDDQDGTEDTATGRTLSAPRGVTVLGNRLYVADSNNRVLVFTGS
jgi:hypothetical protein